MSSSPRGARWEAPLRARIWFAIGKFAVRRANAVAPKFRGGKPYWIAQPATEEEPDFDVIGADGIGV